MGRAHRGSAKECDRTPDERLAIRTALMKFHDETVQTTIRAELGRGGSASRSCTSCAGTGSA
jgi:hypothetical protein